MGIEKRFENSNARRVGGILEVDLDRREPKCAPLRWAAPRLNRHKLLICGRGVMIRAKDTSLTPACYIRKLLLELQAFSKQTCAHARKELFSDKQKLSLPIGFRKRC